MADAKKPSKPVERAWQRMLSGRRLDLLNPSPLDVEIEDIAHGLARVARWNGQTTGSHAFSVAEHSLVVEHIVSVLRPDWPARWRLAALLHDAPEYVIGDLISPFKAAIGLNYKELENQLLGAIHLRFGLPEQLPLKVVRDVKRADKISAYFEAVGLAGFEPAEAKRFFGDPRRLDEGLTAYLNALDPLPAHKAQAAFLTRFKTLIKLMEDGSKPGRGHVSTGA